MIVGGLALTLERHRNLQIGIDNQRESMRQLQQPAENSSQGWLLLWKRATDGRVITSKDHALGGLEAWQGLHRLLVAEPGVPDLGILGGLHPRDDVAHLSSTELAGREWLRHQQTHLHPLKAAQLDRQPKSPSRHREGSCQKAVSATAMMQMNPA